MVNEVTLVGRLTRDAEAVATSGKPMTKMRLATNSRWKDAASGESRESSEFHTVITFGRMAEICATYCTKGRLLYVRGRIRTSTYDDADGKKRYFTEVVASTVTLMPGGNHHEEVEAQPGDENEPALAVVS